LRHWRPGSLIMIDEPELHLHPEWQTKLLAALRFWLHERGGQAGAAR
jgi:predicted ATPase